MKKSAIVSFCSVRLVLAGIFTCAGLTARATTTLVQSNHAVTLTATASGTAPFSYEWRKDGVPVAGEVSASLVISRFQAAHAGAYTAVIANSAGSVHAEEVNLVLAVPPQITVQPVGQTLLMGEASILSAFATGSPEPTYQWRKGGVDIAGATGSDYRIPAASADDAGVYSVVATNAVGSVTSNDAVVIVTTPMRPTITTQPAARSVAAGGSATFSVVATGTPAPTYQWRKNGVAIAGATGASLTLANVATTQAGTYSVVVQNIAGTITSNGAVLTVTSTTAKPVIKTQPAGRSVVAGVAVTFSVTATGSPAPTYQWRKNGVSISGATSASFSLSNPKPTDAGTYSVVVKNSGGSVTSANAVLTVKPLVHADVNADGKSDIIWENVLTGNHRLWTMAGTIKGEALNLIAVTKDWEVIGPGEFNADGKTDLLVQNMVTGEVRVWLLSGTTVASNVSLGIAPAGMYAEGVGDFNADNRSDIIWRNAATNEFSICLMNGVTAGTTVSLGVRSWGMEVAGTGDFNADGKTDILWCNPDTGVVGIWQMSGTTYSKWIELPRLTGDWELGGTGDFNGDGRPDIIWQDVVTGERKVALMSGIAKTGEVSLGTVVPEWFIRN